MFLNILATTPARMFREQPEEVNIFQTFMKHGVRHIKLHDMYCKTSMLGGNSEVFGYIDHCSGCFEDLKPPQTIMKPSLRHIQSHDFTKQVC